jgi:hypothetical protein
LWDDSRVPLARDRGEKRAGIHGGDDRPFRLGRETGPRILAVSRWRSRAAAGGVAAWARMDVAHGMRQERFRPGGARPELSRTTTRLRRSFERAVLPASRRRERRRAGPASRVQVL